MYTIVLHIYLHKKGENMSGMESLSLRISEQEKEYLYSIAEKYNLKKQGSDDLSCAKALKKILSFCLYNHMDIEKKEDENIAEMRKMLEQIHASIPHLMYQQRVQNAILANRHSDEELAAIKDGSIQYLNDGFAGFQNNQYRYVKAKLNKIGMKTIPLEEGQSLWK